MVIIKTLGFKQSDRWTGITSDFEGQLFEKAFVRLYVRPEGNILIYIFDKLMSIVAFDSQSQLVDAIQTSIDDFIELNEGSVSNIKKLIPVLETLEKQLEEIKKQKYIWL